MKEKIAILASEIKSDNKKLSRIFLRFDQAYNGFLNSNEYSKLVESAFYVSQLYSGCENIFKNIARTFENNIDKERWHRSLLERMKIEIKDIRPAMILSEESFKYLNELRSFRHYFRNAYDIDIDNEKFRIVADRVLALKDLWNNEIDGFLSFLDSLL